MYIVYDNKNNINQLRSKYLVLELDSIELKPDNITTAFAVITSDSISLNEISSMDNKKKLHTKLIENYKSMNWKYCNEAIPQLMGSFKGELDSFYVILAERIEELSVTELPKTWNGSLSAFG